MLSAKRGILAELLNRHARLAAPIWAAAGIAGVSLFGMVAAFGTVAPASDVFPAQRIVVTENIARPSATTVETTADIFLREERILRGDTVATLLGRLGVRESEAIEFIRLNKETQAIFRQLSPGKNLSARVSGLGELHALTFPLNGGKDLALVVERQDSGFRAVERPLNLDIQVEMKSAEIRHSLFGASDAAGIPDSVATALADIFGGDIDFHRDLRRGDRFTVIYESVSHQGRLLRTGRILAAEFINNGRTYNAIWYRGNGSDGGYYTADGKNIRKAFLRSPLEFSRVTSGFSNARFHPVLKEVRAHRGIDYGAPIGTRVKATGDGTVEFVGTQGGYGKVVILRHQSRYTTVYGHLSGFAAGIRKGARVTQGDVIAFVGATGLASGPHLHYEFRINEIHQNPLAITLPSAPPLAAGQLEHFRHHAQEYLSRIGMMGAAKIARLD